MYTGSDNHTSALKPLVDNLNFTLEAAQSIVSTGTISLESALRLDELGGCTTFSDAYFSSPRHGVSTEGLAALLPALLEGLLKIILSVASYIAKWCAELFTKFWGDRSAAKRRKEEMEELQRDLDEATAYAERAQEDMVLGPGDLFCKGDGAKDCIKEIIWFNTSGYRHLLDLLRNCGYEGLGPRYMSSLLGAVEDLMEDQSQVNIKRTKSSSVDVLQLAERLESGSKGLEKAHEARNSIAYSYLDKNHQRKLAVALGGVADQISEVESLMSIIGGLLSSTVVAVNRLRDLSKEHSVDRNSNLGLVLTDSITSIRDYANALGSLSVVSEKVVDSTLTSLDRLLVTYRAARDAIEQIPSHMMPTDRKKYG